MASPSSSEKLEGDMYLDWRAWVLPPARKLPGPWSVGGGGVLGPENCCASAMRGMDTAKEEPAMHAIDVTLLRTSIVAPSGHRDSEKADRFSGPLTRDRDTIDAVRARSN